MSENIKKKIERVKALAQGNWDQVVGYFAPKLGPAISSPGLHTSCPVHGGDDGFRVFKDFHQTGGGICNSCGAKSDGLALLSWVLDEKLGVVVRKLDDYFGSSSRPVVPIVRNAPRKAKDDGGKRTLRLRKVWSESIAEPSRSAVIQQYLESRGLPRELVDVMPRRVINVHSSLPCWQRNMDKEMTNFGYFYALISLVENMEGEAITIHRTYLETMDGQWRKATAMPKSKTLMPLKSGVAWSSCAIKLGRDEVLGETLNIAEGIETSLAVIAMGQSHCWAAINATNIGSFSPPAGVKQVILWADKDRPCKRGIRAGHAAAEKLRRHLTQLGIGLEVKFPPMEIPKGHKGVDWLDYYNHTSPKS